MSNVNTRARESVMRYVTERVENTGTPPTCREVEEELGVPRMTAWRYLNKALSEMGVDPAPVARVPSLEVRDEIIRLARDGATITGLARSHQVSQGFVRRLIRDAGVEVAARPRTRRNPETLSKVLNQVTTLTRAHGVPPTQVEVAKALGITSQTVGHHVAILASHGYVLDPDDRAGISLRGPRFHRNCIILARAASTMGSGVPNELRTHVLALVRPVVSKPRVLDGSDQHPLAFRVRAAVEHLYARYGRPATANGLQEVLGEGATWEAIRTCLRVGERKGFYVRAGVDRYGFLPATGDPLIKPAMRLSRADAQGWSKENYSALQGVLRIVLLS